MMKKVIVWLSVTVLIAVALVSVVKRNSLAAAQSNIANLSASQSKLGGQSGPQQSGPQEAEPWVLEIPDITPVVFINGTAYDMGFQYGRQFGASIEFNKNYVWRQFFDRKFTRKHVLSDLSRYESFTKKLDPRLIRQLEGIAEGAKSAGYDVEYVDSLLIGAQYDALYNHPDHPSFGSTAFAAMGSATKDGKPLLASTSDGSWVPLRGLLVAFPEDGNSFISFPRIGTLSQNGFLNSAGLAAVGPVGGGSRDIDKAFGTPVLLLYSYIAQRFSTAEQAANLIANEPRTFGMNYVFQDRSGATIAVESSAAGYATRRPGELGETDFMVVANHALTEKMIPANPGNPPPYRSSHLRYLTAYEYLKNKVGKIDVTFLKQVQSSHSTFDGKVWSHDVQWGGNTVCRHRKGRASSTDLGLIMSTVDLTVYVVTGTPCGTQHPNSLGEYVQLTLKSSPAGVTKQAGRVALSKMSAAWEQLGPSRAAVPKELIDTIEFANKEWTVGLQDELNGNMLERGGNVYEANVYYGKAATHYLRAQAYAQITVQRAIKL